MAKRGKKHSEAKSVDANNERPSSFLGVDEHLLTLARDGDLKVSKWWDEFFGAGGDVHPCYADAYREARILFELGESQYEADQKSRRYGNLALIAAADADALGLAEFWGLSGTCTKIPKRNRKMRREWVSQLSFFLERAGVYLAGVGRKGGQGWLRLVDAGWIEFTPRSSGDGDRVLITDTGKTRLSRRIGWLGRAWNFCPSACEWYLCAMVMRLRGIYDGSRSVSKRRDIIASLLSNEEIGKDSKRTEAERVGILERKNVILEANKSRVSDRIHSIVAKDSKVIREVGKKHLASVNRTQKRKSVQPET